MFKWLKAILRPGYHSIRDFIKEVKFRKSCNRVKRSRINKAIPKGHTFFIMTVKRTAYVNLLIKNINSLHLYNHGHKIKIFCDPICDAEIRKIWNKFDYPNQIDVVKAFNADKTPWQYMKVETLMQAAQEGGTLVDADTVWHADPIFPKDKVVFLVKAYSFSEQSVEKFVIENVLNKPEWIEKPHYVTGFVHIPQNLYSEKLKKSAVELTKQFFELNQIPGATEDQVASIRRISEEIGVGLSVQLTIPSKLITTLKDTDGPGNTHMMESLYFGCINKVEE